MIDSIKELQCCSLFTDLDQAELVRVFELVEAETFQAGAVILEQGLTHRNLWIVLRGTCEVVRLSGNGSDQQLAVLEPGGIFGEMSFLKEAPHSATVRALSEVETIRITYQAFEELQRADLHAAMMITSNLVQLLSERLRRMDAWIGELVDQSDDRRQHAEWREFRSKLYSDWSF